jgi:DNA repair protein SbcC/Rad50
MRLLQLRLNNFKVIKDDTFEFKNDHSFVYGKNGIGKTTIADAYTWLLFDKDSDGKSDFSIKTNDANGNPIPNLDHSVEGVFLMPNGDKLTLKKVLVEKWGTDKDTQLPKLLSNETEYWWNNAHIAMGKYKTLLTAIIDEKIFKLLSDPHYFSSKEYGWKNRREIIVQIANISETDKELMKGKFDELAKRLSAYKDLNLLQSETKNEIARLKKKIEVELPIQIKTITENITGEELSLSDLTEKKGTIENEIAQINGNIENAIDTTSIKVLQDLSANKIKLQAEISNMEFSAKNEILKKLRGREQELTNLEDQIGLIKKEINRLEVESSNLTVTAQKLVFDNNNLRVDYQKIWAEQLVFDGYSCPTCERKYDPERIEQEKAKALAKFETFKQSRLAQINTTGKANKATLDKINETVNDLDEQIKTAQNILKEKEEELVQLKASKIGVETSQAILERNEDYKSAIGQMEAIEAQIKHLVEIPAEDKTTALKEKRTALQAELQTVITNLEKIDRAAKDRATIADLEREIQNLSQTRSDLENIDIQINEFNKFKVSLIDQKISAIFPNVKFKMFEMQMNGGMDDNHCTTMLGGVPWPDLNTAGKLNAGMEIISVLQNRFNIAPPIFIDNRESVTEIYPTAAQTISLVVHPDHETLKTE